MKRTSTLLSLLLATLVGISGSAQHAPYSKMSPHTRILLDQLAKEDTSRSSLRGAVAGEYLSAFVKVETEAGWTDVEAMGCQVQTRAGDIATVLIPLSQVEALSKLASVQYISASQPMTLSMDSARYYSNVADAYAGKNLPKPYTGKDVIVGVVDQGLDFTHPNFYDKEGKTYRLKRVWDQTSPLSSAVYTTETDILEHECSFDSEKNTHGSHVMGIAAGGGYDTPYQGVAYESDIMAVATTMQDADIVNGVNYLFQESEKAGKPCVVNLSLGSSTGAHDGTGLFDQMLDRLVGPGKIITVAMGNSGGSAEYLELMSPSDTLRTFIGQTRYPFVVVDLWADEPWESFAINVDLYDHEKKEMLGSTGFLSVDTVLASIPLAIIGPDSLKYTAEISSSLSPFNEKYNVRIVFAYPEKAKGIDFGLQVATKGTPVRAWANMGIFKDNDMSPLYSAGTGDFSIGTPATAHDVISVGAYSSRLLRVDAQGDSIVFPGSELGKLTPFSSVGPTIDNRIKPDITAPGCFVISSYNSYYLEEEAGEGDRKLQVRYSSFNDSEYPWGYMQGTSMSCPFVTGTIALWLQANPTLSPDDIKEIFSRTAIQDQANETYPNSRWGWGKIDAYKGLLDILGIPTASENIFEEKPEEAVSVYAGTSPGSFHIRWAEIPGAFSIQVFDAAGRSWYGEKVEAPASMDFPVALGSFQPGIYFIQIKTAEGTVERKIRL
ncbi:MAG: S8 family peptidase [Parabacteroides sp.]|nr:S8 family peptidase [Parabacteroides sp.]